MKNSTVPALPLYIVLGAETVLCFSGRSGSGSQ
jgi:hypothetical protein